MDFGLFFKILIQAVVVVYGVALLCFLYRIIVNEKGEYFYSNCLIEAIKAKIENPKVKITVIPRGGRGLTHFLWSDGEYDDGFGAFKELSRLQALWFKGKIFKRGLGFNEEYKRMARCKRDK